MKKNPEKAIREHCTANGIHVKSGRSFYYQHDTRTISEVRRCKGQSWIFSMLHELGHAAMMSESAYPDNVRIIWSGELHNAIKHTIAGAGRTELPARTGKDASVFIVIEEAAAWSRGYAIGKEIGIDIDATEYERYAEACIRGYILHVTQTHATFTKLWKSLKSA